MIALAFFVGHEGATLLGLAFACPLAVLAVRLKSGGPIRTVLVLYGTAIAIGGLGVVAARIRPVL